MTLLVAGCSSIGQHSTALPKGQQQASDRPYHQNIDLDGRLSVHYQQNGKDHAVHGNFSWSQAGERIMLTLFAPLGQTIATIEVTPQQSTLIQADHPPRTAIDADTLATEALGWPLPLNGLHDWLQGFAQDMKGLRFVATPQQDAIITGDGWHLHYVSWQDQENKSAPRPRRIDLAHNPDSSNQADEVALRIVIDHWQPR